VSLREKIVKEIRERGPIPFSRYMDLCLYDPQLGYYSKNAEQFGRAGDFYTSSDVHAVFGRLLARQFEEMWRVLGRPPRMEILELGPGRGLFAQDVLDWSEKKFPQFFAALHYSLMERSPALREHLQVTLSRHFDAGRASFPRLPGQDTLMARAFAPEIPLIVFANEFFDALPVEIVGAQGELRISEKDGRFIETWVPASAEAARFLDRYSVRPESGERVEISFLAQQYMAAIAGAVGQGFVIAIDYGYTQHEQLAGRHRGTLMGYRRHSVSVNPYEAPGEQDITAHVNFTALAAAAEQNGMQSADLLTQSQFLMGIGEHNQFADAFEACVLPQERAKVALQLKHLVTPAGMGESFQVLLCSRGVEAAQLSGLSFGKGRI
jgi:SAM-dependent MidA family methyltransferase